MKRILDVWLAGLALLLLSPVIACTAAVVRITMGSPVLFRQVRPGRNGESFTLLKFRTMTEGGGDDAERVTRVGSILRSTSVDELPELWNVVKGDMSLVGPRPLLVDYLDLYSTEQARRHEVRPGITGLAQVLGRNDTTWERRLELDVWYVDNRSIWLDLKILAMTLRQVVRRQGISAEGHATMPRFEGTEG